MFGIIHDAEVIEKVAGFWPVTSGNPKLKGEGRSLILGAKVRGG